MNNNIRKAEKQLEELLNQLESRVEERTKELNDANLKLQMAVDKVKQISGLLLICSYCKKVRDDTGDWKQIELYIRDILMRILPMAFVRSA